MIKAPSIKGSAQARLLLYRLMSHKLNDAEQQLLNAEPSLLEKLLDALENEALSDSDQKAIKAILSEAFSYIERSTREGLQKQIERLSRQSLWLGIFPSSLLDSFIAEHLKLIKGLQHEHRDKIGLAIGRGMRQGHLHKEIAKNIRQLTDMSKRRAQLIARSAPLQYSGEITRHYQMSAGITSYVWQSSRDERVRDSHRRYDGEIFNWDSAGPRPRSEVNCRCDAVPILA